MKGILIAVCVLMLSVVYAEVPDAVRRQAETLASILKEADEAYYVRADPIMSDAAYDALRAGYEALCRKYPELAEAGRVGAAEPAGGDIVHELPVLSLQKLWTDEEAAAFVERCGAGQMFCIEPKIDGVSAVLRYRGGVLAEAVTRGDGKAGKDITRAVVMSGAAPLSLTNCPASLLVRGEVYIPKTAFVKLNTRRAAEGLEPLKSARNTAAGTLRLHDAAEIAARGLEFCAFEWIKPPSGIVRHSEALERLESFGLEVVECRRAEAPQVLTVIEAMNRQRGQWAYETDGLVVRVNDFSRFQELGSTARYPKGAAARKFRSVPVETELLSIEWSVSAGGRRTPVAVFRPVVIDGAEISRASLYNEEHLLALGLEAGDRILVIREGGVIPEVVGRAESGL